MTTTDPFTTVAREYAESACYQDENRPIAEAGFLAGCRAARSYLAAQETDAERAVRELHRPEMTYRLIDGEDFAQEPDAHVCTECRDLYPCGTIEALDAARRARGETT